MATKIPELPVPTWFVGCGNMGAAILAGMRMATIDLNWVTIIRPSGRTVESVRAVSSFDEAGSPPNLVILAVKPQQLDQVAEQLQPYISFGTVIVSLLAGVEISSLRARFPEAAAIVRAMPNVAVAVRRGVTALYSEDADDQVRQQLSELFVTLGYTIWAKDEAKLAAIGSVAAAGPAYVARFVAALAKAAEAQGISRETAATLALETVFGTAWLGASSGDDMGAIAARVASPNGTTEAGLKVLDHDHVLDELVGLAIAAASQRGAELAEAARSRSLEEPSRLH